MSRRLLGFLAATMIVVSACGGTAATQAPAATTAPTAAPAATTAPTAAPAATPAPTAAATEAPSSAPATGGSVSFTRFAEAAPVFHTVEAQSNQYMLYYLVFDTLAALDLSDTSLQTIKPRMAESWEISPDATTFTFKLRKDIKWHDGTPFTADDVVFTATWAAENKTGFVGFPPAWFSLKDQAVVEKACTAAGGATGDPTKCGGTSEFAGVKKIDDYTVQFVLEAPDVFFLRTMVDAPSVILPKHLLVGQTVDQVNKGDFKNKAPIGTGPFKLKEIAPDQFISFEANADYYGGKPKLDTVIYKAIKTDTALAQLESGDLDAAFNVGAGNFDKLSTVSLLNVQTVSAPGIFTMVPFIETNEQRKEWNTKFKLNLPDVNIDLSDPRVRQAMYFGIDRAAINDQLFGGRNKILWNPPGFNPDGPGLEKYAFDAVKAKGLLDAAIADKKFDPTKSIRLMVADELADAGKIAPIVKQQLEAIGFKIELNVIDIDTYNTWATSDQYRDKYDMAFGAGGSEGLSPSRSQIYFKAINCGEGINDEPPNSQSGYYNCDLRKLFLKARTQVDAAEQAKTYEEIATILNTDLPQMYFWQLAGVHAVNKRVQGIVVPSFERYVTIDASNWSVTQ